MRKLHEWIEYMEGEGLLKPMSKLALLLKHSLVDQVILDNLRRLRRLVKQLDPAFEIEEKLSSAEFLNDFHSQTMNQIKDWAQKNQAKKSDSLPTELDLGSSQDSYKR